MAKGYIDARRDACAVMAPIAAAWKSAAQGVLVVGTSGTIEAVQSVLTANGFDSGPITRDGVADLERAIVDRRWVTDLGVPGLAPERVDIFPAGLAAVAAILETLDITRIEFVDASLQHGLLYDLVGQRASENVQERTIEGWRRRFNVDRDHTRRVARLGRALLASVCVRWDLADDDCRCLLKWAADLHEIGLMVSARQHNRHGAYLVENGDLPGFSVEQRRAIALLIRSHRGGFPMFAFAAFSEPMAQRLKRLAILLRLAVIFERTRTDADSPDVTIEANAATVELTLDGRWLADHALSRAELEVERERLAAAGVVLNLNTIG
jgi:exopolyphosphatase/guanosine-5'-triphosphate,3'-diphosphate pyrophosphatase